MSWTDMTSLMREKTVAHAIEMDRGVRISDFILLSVLPFRVVAYEGYPVNEVAMALLVALSVFRRSRGGARLPVVVGLVLAALLVLLIGSGVASVAVTDGQWVRRVGHIAVLAGLIWALGTGRVSLRSSALGLGAGLIVVSGLALAGIGGDTYPGRLTGYLGDPNAGAYFLVTLGLLAVFFSDDSWKVRLALGIPVAGALVLTYSRTGLLAVAFAFVWLLFGRRLSAASGVALCLALVWLVAHIPEDLQTFGPFSNRSGSDALRKRIIQQEYVQLADIPWYGDGPGSARVEVRGQVFFFHNSYLATRHEGGWLALVLVLALLVIALIWLAPFAREGDVVSAAAQAAIVSVAAMSITLGEVLLDTPMAIAVGFALGHVVRQRERAGPHG